jgi:hypothetical protein
MAESPSAEPLMGDSCGRSQLSPKCRLANERLAFKHAVLRQADKLQRAVYVSRKACVQACGQVYVSGVCVDVYMVYVSRKACVQACGQRRETASATMRE